MSEPSFADVIAQVERDFGIAIERSAPKSLSGIPETLRPLYEFSDGLTLPFGEIYKAADCDRTTDPGWVTFGFDYYFSFFLCHESDRLAFTTWDHDSRTRIEGVYASALEWLIAEYEGYIAADTRENSVHIVQIPCAAAKTSLIAELKRVSEKSTGELLALMRSGSFVVENVIRSDAFHVVRALQGLGVKCHVVCDIW
ncbi:MAG: hypothetical protein QNI99_17055 [Woeseiaceae bacterium]|nr:hypothetical protein [Woeseiaceae bacterium]